MALLIAGIALVTLGLIAKYDRTMPTWLRTTLMVAVILVLGISIAIAATIVA